MDGLQFVVGFLFVLHTTYAKLPNYALDCGSKEGNVTSVTVSRCAPTDHICSLHKGSTVHVTVEFKSKEVINNATAVVHGIIKGVSLPFPIPEANGCKSGLHCPVKSGAEPTYESNIQVEKLFPDLQVIVKWELKDEHSAEIFCLLFRSQIVG